MFAVSAGLILFFIFLFALVFFKRQNGPAASTGGPISKPKALWLAYGIGSWFLFPFIFLLHPDVANPIKIVFGIHLVSWWARGPLELIMIYKWFNWTPVYGISHDILHIMTVFLVSSWALASVGLGALSQPLNATAFSFIAAIIFSTVAEVLFAALFLATRDEGDHLIYFADESAKFRLINRFTTFICTVVYVHLVSLVGILILYS